MDTTAGNAGNGIQIASGSSLTIRDSSAPSTGTLTVTNNADDSVSDNSGAAINTTDGTLIIKSGSVTATGSGFGAGIGGGYKGEGGIVTITGGTVEATGSIDGAGIGGGYRGDGGTVDISGGTVDATGSGGAGIGGGYGSNSGAVTISGGTVAATSTDGAGIGGGNGGVGGMVEISGGTVTATSTNGVGIGGGDSGSVGTLQITGGSVHANYMTGEYAAVPKSSGDSPLYLATLTVKGSNAVLENASLDSTGHSVQTGGSPYPYGTKDVKTDANGKVYFWLPAANYNISLNVGGTQYINGRVVVTTDNAGAAELKVASSSPPSSGSTYKPRTLTDVPTVLSVSGALSSGATLRINSFTPAHNSTDPALAAMRKRMDSLTDTLIFCADITVSGNYSGPLTLSFEVSSH